MTGTMTGAARRVAGITGMAIAMLLARSDEAKAHCDTMDGPVVAAARRSLESGSVAHVLIWVRAQDETEIRGALQQAMAVRRLGADARALADRYFFETVVRIHREGEGEPYTGLKPSGTDLGKAIPAADRALAAGTPGEIEELLVHEVKDALRERFDRVNAAKRFAADDVAAGRAYVAAYVAFTHYVEQVHAAASTGHGGSHAPDGAHRAP